MSERSNVRELLSKRTMAGLGAVLCSLALAACDNTVTADKASIGTCGPDAYNRQGEHESPVTSTSRLIASAAAGVLTLQQRVIEGGGTLTLDSPAYPRILIANQNKLTLEFERNTPTGHTAHDTVNFPIAGGKAPISPGAIICSHNNTLYPNGTYHAIQQYLERTATLSK